MPGPGDNTYNVVQVGVAEVKVVLLGFKVRLKCISTFSGGLSTAVL